MIGGRYPQLGIQWAAPPSGVPAPTLYLPLRTDLLDASANAWPNASASLPTIDAIAASPIGAGCAAFAAGSSQHLAFLDDTLLDPGTGDWFVAFWAYTATSGNTSSYPCAVAKGSYQSSTGAWVIFNEYSVSGINFAYGNPWVPGPSTGGSPVYPNNEWRHIYTQRSGDTLSMWSSAVNRGSQSVAGADFTSTHDLTIGRNLSGDYWNGFLQDLVYCKGSVLTPAQITDLQTSSYGDLL
jgi:hypothetical protein